MKLLLVDDNEALLTALGRMVGVMRPEWRVATACNGRRALERLSEESFDALVTDILMPEMEGLETIRHLRKSHPDLVVVAMSGGGLTLGFEVLEHAKLLGAAGALEKPFRCSDLIAMLEKFTGAPDAAPSVLGNDAEPCA